MVVQVDLEHLTIQEVAARLGVHYMTAYRYVRLGVLPARKVGNTWQIRADDVASLEAGSSSRAVSPNGSAGRPRSRAGRVPWSARLETRMLAGDSAGSWAVLEAAQASGASVTDLYLQVIGPALHSVGDRWAAGEIDVADEHQAAAVATRLVGRLGPRLARPGQRRRSVVVGGVPGDAHGLPVSMAADLIGSLGFHVLDLGPDVPAASFVHAASQAPRLGLVVVTVTVADLVPAAADVLADLRGSFPGTPLAVGGRAVPDAEAAAALGADLWAPDALALGRRLEGDDHPDG